MLRFALPCLLIFPVLADAQIASTAQRSRAEVVQDYNENYVAAKITSVGWTGSTEHCRAGTIAPATYAKVLSQLNFFRRMAGYTEPVTLDAGLYPQMQRTALMMDANSNLSHRPDASWKCYSEDAAIGANKSNLHLGYSATNAIVGFMEDKGAANHSVGHRRYILESRNGVYSFGATEKAAALHVFGGYKSQPVPETIAWPPAGFVPRDIVFGRWSFCLPEGKFDSARVEMRGPEGKVPLRIVNNEATYGDPGIVWEPENIKLASDTDVSYTVRVSNIRGAEKREYTYTVTIIRP